MFCINCGRQINNGGRFCGHCGTARAMAGVFPADAPTHGDARPVNDPTHRALVDSRYWVQAGSVACGLLTALHVIGLFGPADGAMKFGTLIGGVICAVIARKLWILNSVPAAVGALIMLSLEATGIVIAAVVVTQQAPSDRLFGCVAVCSISALMVFLGYQTLRSARRIRRFAMGS